MCRMPASCKSLVLACSPLLRLRPRPVPTLPTCKSGDEGMLIECWWPVQLSLSTQSIAEMVADNEGIQGTEMLTQFLVYIVMLVGDLVS